MAVDGCDDGRERIEFRSREQNAGHCQQHDGQKPHFSAGSYFSGAGGVAAGFTVGSGVAVLAASSRAVSSILSL